jgi:hypothetical protein
LHFRLSFEFMRLLLLAFALLITADSYSQSRCICNVPRIVSQPASTADVCPAQQTAVQVNAYSATTLQYQWQLDSVDITDNSYFSGSKSPLLTLSNPPASLHGKTLRCKVVNCLGIPVYSDLTYLNFDLQETDLNQDGYTSNADFAMLLRVYNNTCSGCPEDISGDGNINILDFLRLLAKFNTTCN